LKISLIVAASQNRVIGAAGGIPWRLPDDQKLFKELTLGHCIVMGRGTFESIGRPLPGRTTIVLSRSADYSVPGALMARDLDSAFCLARERGEEETFVVGGAAVYEAALPRAHCLHLTRVHAEVEGDVLFPEFEGERGEEGRAAWRLIEERLHPADDRHAHAFTYQRWERADPGSVA